MSAVDESAAATAGQSDRADASERIREMVGSEIDLAAVKQLLDVLSDQIQRLSARTDDADTARLLRELAVQDQVARPRATVLAKEAREPLRRRILTELAADTMTPTELATRLDSPVPSISRLLRRLTEEDLLSVSSDRRDRRRRVYSLTQLGQAQLTEHTAFGAPSRPAPPDRERAVAYLRDALEAAVGLRRRTGRFDAVLDRLNAVIVQAKSYSSPALVLAATAELINTLRQNGERDRLRPHLDELQHIAAGRTDFPAELVMPALGFLEYELGRLPESDGGDPVTGRIEHLVTAHQLFDRLGRERDDVFYRRRSALAKIALADVWRERTQLDYAVLDASRALIAFDQLDDTYGVARARLVLGSSLRLRGQFVDALGNLSHARRLAADNRYERMATDALAQMGEVHRCRGETDEAIEYLREASERAQGLSMKVTEAFAESALGAALWDLDDYDQAMQHLNASHELFAQAGHAEGMALNLRRRAVVQSYSSNALEHTSAGEQLNRALDDYERMESPAGMVACVIGLGRVTSTSRGKAALVTRLVRWLGEGTWTRRLTEMDPWVPRMLAAFASETDDDRLAALSVAVLRGSDRRLTEFKDERLAPLPGRRALSTRVRSTVDSMAGEPRRKAAFALQPA